MLEKRISSRRRTLLNGRIEVDKLNGWAVSCSVRNVSDGGARVTLSPGPIVPDSFLLGISNAEPRPARLVWYRDGQAGIALSGHRDRGDAPKAPTEPLAAAPATATRLETRIHAIAARRSGGRRFTPL